MTAPLAPEQFHLAANAIRALAIDAVNQANSGHPGAPMGLADVATVLFTEVLRHDPKDPAWPDRDRFVLSNGHASMLLYACLHLSGYDLPMAELRRFRQLGSKTPGHPEFGLTPGVETTTGPLGQGFANAVGMALGRRLAAARLPADGAFAPVSHHVYAICGDGCLMEGISSEAASLAGHLGLGELVVLYDDNGISIDGSTSLAFSEDVEMRFSAVGWHTARIDGHDPDRIRAALAEARAETGRPSLIAARTRIGFGSPNREGTAKAHGEPLGTEEAEASKLQLGWTHPPFEVPEAAYAAFRPLAEAGGAARSAWQTGLDGWLKDADRRAVWEAHHGERVPTEGAELEALVSALPEGKAATRALSGKVMNLLAPRDRRIVGGSADLTGSNKTKLEDAGVVGPGDFSGRNLHFGVREHAMGAMVNGLALYGGFVPFGATFLTFSDYMKNAVRLSAMMRIRAVQVYTHDSIGLGEDGPTHQPIEHLWGLRGIPGLTVWRPADATETLMAWLYAVERGEPGPHALVFSRQGAAPFERQASFRPESVWDGAYAVDDEAEPEVILVSTGTEVTLALAAAERLVQAGRRVRTVSMPSVERFRAQPESTREALLPSGVPRVSVEAGSTLGWPGVLAGGPLLALGIDAFGESAPSPDVYAHFGLTPEAVADRITGWLDG